MKLWLIEWDDTHADTEWTPIEGDCSPAPCYTVGVILHDKDNYLEVIGTCCVRGMKLQQIAIPKGCIKRMRRLKIEMETPGT